VTTGHHNSIIHQWGDNERKAKEGKTRMGEGRRKRKTPVEGARRGKGKRGNGVSRYFCEMLHQSPSIFFFLLFYANPSRTRLRATSRQEQNLLTKLCNKGTKSFINELILVLSYEHSRQYCPFVCNSNVSQ